MTAETNGFPIRITAPDQQFRKTFNSEDEVRNFLAAEQAYWDQLSSLYSERHIHSPMPEILNLLTRHRIRQATGNAGTPSRLETDLEGVILSDGIYGRIISDLALTQPLAVPAAVFVFSAKVAPSQFDRQTRQYNGHNISFSAFASLAASMEAIRGPDRKATASRAKLTDLVDEAQALRDEVSALKDDELRQHREQIDAARALIEQQKIEFAEMVTAAQGDLDAMLARSKATIEDLEEKTKNRIILEAPTAYWTAKAHGHRTAAIAFGALFVLALLSGTYWITHYGVQLVAHAHDEIIGDKQEAGLLALIPLAFITLPTLAFAWLLRHVSRIIVQNIALGADAQLRGTIATTYSAITSDRPANPAEMAIALQALFRPVDGAAHSEIAPPNIQEIMDMAFGNKKV